MTDHVSVLFRVLVLLLLTLAPRGGAAEVYDTVLSDLMATSRQAGTPGYRTALQAVKARLDAAGLRTGIQTFDTVIEQTATCEVRIGGTLLSGAHVMANGVATWVTKEPVSGSLLWAGDGSLAALDGKPVQGSIALLDLNLPNPRVDHLFTLGARAVLCVGGEQADAWSLAGLHYEGPSTVPRIWLDVPESDRVALRSREGDTVVLSVSQSLEDTVAENLWAVIPGRDTQFNLGQPEVIVLSATLDSTGLVPAQSPNGRLASNAALLTEVACRLAESTAGSPPDRTIMFAFYGDRYGAQAGARNFYYAVDKGRLAPGDYNSLAYRKQKYEEERGRLQAPIAACDRLDLFSGEDAEAVFLRPLIKEKLVGKVNNINARLQEIRVKADLLQRESHRLRQLPESEPERGELAAVETELERLNGLVPPISEHKTEWNNLRRQLNDRQLGGDEASQRALRAILDEIRTELQTRSGQISRLIEHNATHAELGSVVGSRQVVAHFDFDFSNAESPWMFGISATSMFYHPEGLDTGPFLLHLSQLQAVDESVRESDWTPGLFTPALHPFYKPYSLSIPFQRSVPSTVVITVGGAGFQLMTVGADLSADGLPVSPVSDLSALSPQLTTLGLAWASRPELSLRSPIPQPRVDDRLTYLLNKGDDYTGRRFVTYARGTADVEGPTDNAVVYMTCSEFHDGRLPGLPGLSSTIRTRVNANGYPFIPMINRTVSRDQNTYYLGYAYDEEGRVNRYGVNNLAKGSSSGRIPLFYGYGGGTYSFGFNPDLLGSGQDLQTQTLDAKSDSAFRTFGYFRTGHVAGFDEFYADRNGRFKWIGQFGSLLLGSNPEQPLGTGIPLSADSMLHLNAIRQGAHDYWLLNESRLQVLRQRNLVNNALEGLHAEAQEHLEKADLAEAAMQHAEAQGHQIFATSLENRVHGPLKGITQDLVRAVVVLLLLNIPFAFAMERLLFGSTSIYRQVLGFVGMFMGTFVILYITHPAFKLAAAPLVIFLAFVIILLGVITVSIVLSKIKLEIRAIQGLASTAHGKGNDANTGMAAVLIGISGMRNRPLKTFLTCLTVILLTFTILVFASFTSELGVVEVYQGQERGEDRIELHRYSFLNIPEDLLSSVRALYAEEFDVAFRGGMFRNPSKAFDRGDMSKVADRVVLNPATGTVIGLGAIMGLSQHEVDHNADIRKVAPSLKPLNGLPPLYLPVEAADRLGAKPGDRLLIMGQPFSYAGPIDNSAMLNATTIEGQRIVPPDFESTINNLGKNNSFVANTDDLESMDVGSFAWFSPENVAVTDIGMLQQYFPYLTYLNFVSMYPRNDEVDVEAAARELSPVFQGAVHVTSPLGAKQMFFTKAVKGSGFNDVIIPLLLGGLIIFSSLMGSIVDREKEIFTYSALGLSPPNVGALFFAESSVYAVVGGLGGYLLSQLVAKGLEIMGRLGWFTPPDMNFSSLTSVATILLVMAVVMLSTIFPAIKAGKSANPGVSRKWRMPAPDGDHMKFIFPFTVSEADFAGILSFIHEHFENHSDATLGTFAAKDVALFKDETSSGIRADISLAPFDLGIFQRFRMYSQEFDIEGIEEVVVELEREGGSPSSWIRGNRTFADELREQFLLWRSLPIETVEHYRAATRAILESPAKEEPA